MTDRAFSPANNFLRVLREIEREIEIPASEREEIEPAIVKALEEAKIWVWADREYDGAWSNATIALESTLGSKDRVKIRTGMRIYRGTLICLIDAYNRAHAMVSTEDLLQGLLIAVDETTALATSQGASP